MNNLYLNLTDSSSDILSDSVSDVTTDTGNGVGIGSASDAVGGDISNSDVVNSTIIDTRNIMTTPLVNYSVTEGLLLLIFFIVCIFCTIFALKRR